MKLHRLVALIVALVLVAPLALSAKVQEGERPTLDAVTLDGQPVTADSLRGQVVLVDFWATWCAPCRRSFPFYEEMVERYGEQGFTVVAISVDTGEAPVRNFLEQVDAPFQIVVDTDHRLAERFAPATMPTSYLLDRQGQVRLVHEGFRATDHTTLEAHIKRLLTE